MSSDAIQLREWENLNCHDPVVVLAKYREIEPLVATSDLPPEVKSLRRDNLKVYREGRDAALFCLGMSRVLGTKVYVMPAEASDHDFVSVWQRGQERVFTPVQLKELVPHAFNPTATLNDTLAGLRRYGPMGRTVVAVLLNRQGPLVFSEIVVPKVQCGGIWLYGAASPNQHRWYLYGDLLGTPHLHEYEYPA